MDFSVRYFKDDHVVTRYLSLAFLEHTTSEDLKLKFEEVCQDLNTKRMVQVSMDGPNVNWKILNKITEKRCSVEHYPGLINVASCSLHFVHGAFRSSVIKTDWGIDLVLKALHNLFDESPAKREDYIKVTGSKMFALPFCHHRWIEDKKVAERALQIWPHIITYISETLKKSKSQILTPSSFSTLRLAAQDKLITANLEFFVSVAAVLKPYFEIFQSDAPLLPFITSELQVMLETPMRKFVKTQELEALDTPLKISKVNVLAIENHVAESDIDVGFAAAATVSKALKEKNIRSASGIGI